MNLKNFRDLFLKKMSNFETKTETIFLAGKKLFCSLTGRSNQQILINPASEIQDDDSFLIYNQQTHKKKIFVIRTFSWKMFFYGWMGFGFIAAKRFFLASVLIFFTCFYLYAMYKSLAMFSASLSSIQIDETIQTASDLKSKIKYQSTANFDLIALGLSIFFGFFGEPILVHGYIKNGWKIAPVKSNVAKSIKKKYFLKRYTFEVH